MLSEEFPEQFVPQAICIMNKEKHLLTMMHLPFFHSSATNQVLFSSTIPVIALLLPD